MARPSKLAGRARDEALEALKAAGWTHDAGADTISRSFRFKDFSAAFGWMTRAALAAEKLDHHPDWSNVYNRVEVSLTTHDVKGLTELDVKLAEAMDAAL
ncbi:4a-hydroxytetrahydrobiopterin dehydratase [Pararhodobacter marinus]|uniref:Putative pterin-4-alpha-carbinolamine dehydratase n=1 Tax=Pararhodobacter marinus TaxID=2184063 RepID=A0A2U2CCN8_9RHOB|nr:4a-hydroxytetrahydrobiopterin dehydratase [Pararhodobacter marinus]PWE29619.1 4a-hydroxytetrahydrobiopterin dehydratase [Pararhodobacter marinus]